MIEQSDELNKIVVLPLETNSKDQDQINLAVGLTQDISGALTGASKQLNIINVNKVPDELSQIHEEMQASYLINDLRFDNFSINLIDAKTSNIGQIIMIENLRLVAFFKFEYSR